MKFFRISADIKAIYFLINVGSTHTPCFSPRIHRLLSVFSVRIHTEKTDVQGVLYNMSTT